MRTAARLGGASTPISGYRGSAAPQVAAFAIYTGIEAAAGQWSFAILSEGRAVPLALAGTGTAIFWSALCLGRVAVGFVADRLRLCRPCERHPDLRAVGRCGDPPAPDDRRVDAANGVAGLARVAVGVRYEMPRNFTRPAVLPLRRATTLRPSRALRTMATQAAARRRDTRCRASIPTGFGSSSPCRRCR